MRDFDQQPLTSREMKVYLWLLRETMEAADLLAAKIRAAEIIAANTLGGNGE